ncbi:MFS transporter [Acinetobacter sp. MD2(2019)]|uniref:MFS transporter n=1 Tax=Acinetobacter sp. MD2(2019) TaxID=2605273 RepID=UPI002D1E67AF|nr:MFS transporter [Acinetobacter sp. MD2(2019)]MEB3752769.1 MFS transporter [Acinetobacter sp. MD2(2019)]
MDFEKNVIRTVTLKLIPALIILYLVAYIDRAAVGFAHLHMGADVGIGDAAYGLGAGIFFIGYFIFEVPSNLLLDKFGPRRWFARILLSWGLVTMAMALIQGPNSFYLLRFLLGVAEAGFFPGVLYLITQWFPVRHRGKVMGMFVLAQPIAMMVAGPLSGALLGMDGLSGLHGWQWLFIIVGLPAVILSVPTLLFLPDRVDAVKWLSGEQKIWLKQELHKDESEYQQTRHANPLHALKDKRVLLLSLYYLPAVLSIYGLNLWMPIIMKQFAGGSDLQIGFLAGIPYFFAILGLLIIPRSSDRTNDRFGHLTVLHGVGAVSIFLSAWLASPVLQLMALSTVALCLFSTVAVFWTLPGRFLTGVGAAAGIALINSVGNLGGYLGPFVIGILKQKTGSVASGLYFLSIVMLIGLILTYLVYLKLEKNRQTT